MKKHILILALMLECLLVKAQLTVSSSASSLYLVQNILIGSGVTVKNVTFTGDNLAKGSFDNGSSTNLGLSSGVVLSTGYISSIPNNTSAFASTNLSCCDYDPQLTSIASTTVYDANVVLIIIVKCYIIII